MIGSELLWIDSVQALAPALRRARIPLGSPVLVLVGGASGMTEEVLPALTELFVDALVPMLDRLGVVVVDGGTDAGVMRLIGQARTESAARFPLIGVAASGTVAIPGRPSTPDMAAVATGHTHLILVPGQQWGDESPWLAAVGTAVAAGQPSATLLVNGGAIAYRDAEYSLAAGRRLVVLEGSGRTADVIARAKRGEPIDQAAAGIANSALTQCVSLAEPQSVVAAIAGMFAARTA